MAVTESSLLPRAARPSPSFENSQLVETLSDLTGLAPWKRRAFCPEGVDPFSTVDWHRVDCSIAEKDGTVVFSQEGVLAPTGWSERAVTTAASKYFWGKQGTPERETSIRSLIHRVVRCLADYALAHGYLSPAEAEVFYDDLCWLALHQFLAWNSPVWFNVGIHPAYGHTSGCGDNAFAFDPETGSVLPADGLRRPQASACYISHVPDDVDGIWGYARDAAKLFKYGSGSGASWSTLRSKIESLSGGGQPSGPVSFMKLVDVTGGTIKSGGRCRRAAIIFTLDDFHPDLVEFIECKPREEDKALALIHQGYDPDFNGEAYGSVAFQNANLSVRLSDEFLRCVEEDGIWTTRRVTDGLPGPRYPARELLYKIAQAAWRCGDPGVQYSSTINAWHTVKQSGPIASSNPCCLVGPTLVDTNEGKIPIERLEQMCREGKELPLAFAYDKVQQKSVSQPIVRAWVAGTTSELVKVTTSRGVVVLSTPEHRFLTYQGEYVRADQLPVGTFLCNPDPHPAADDKVVTIERVTLHEPVPVYDLEVQGVHNFSVTNQDVPGAATIVVHNSEFLFLDDTACNLLSLNLLKFRRPDGRIDLVSYLHACRLAITSQELLVDLAGYPTKAMAQNSHDFRPLGLGYTNLGGLLMSLGMPYDSDEARRLAGGLTSLLTATAYAVSSHWAERVGPFPAYAHNADSMLAVMVRHQAAADELGELAGNQDDGYQELHEVGRAVWAAVVEKGSRYGYRNAQASVLAPAGTISFLMDCGTTGVEPELGLIKWKRLAGGGHDKLVNQLVGPALCTLGYSPAAVRRMLDYIDESGGRLEGSPDIQKEHLPVFDTSLAAPGSKRTLSWRAHLLMMAAVQPFVSGAISKTVNVPEEVTPQDIAELYLEGHRLGLKCLAIYRDNSKGSQPLSMLKEGKKATPLMADPVVMPVAVPVAPMAAPVPSRHWLPETRQGVTHKFSLGGHKGYLHTGEYADGTLGEIFLTMSKEGSTVGGLVSAVGILTSLALQYRVPLEVLVRQLSYTRFEPAGMTGNPQIPVAHSVLDYVFRWLEQRYLQGTPTVPVAVPVAGHEGNGHAPGAAPGNGHAPVLPGSVVVPVGLLDSPPCDFCGAITVRSGRCWTCTQCSSTSGCG